MSENTEEKTEQSPRDKAKAFYDLTTQLTQHCKVRFRGAPLDSLEETLGAYLSLVQQPATQVKEDEDPPTMEVSVEIMRQMALLASANLARIITDRYKMVRK